METAPQKTRHHLWFGTRIFPQYLRAKGRGRRIRSVLAGAGPHRESGQDCKSNFPSTTFPGRGRLCGNQRSVVAFSPSRGNISPLTHFLSRRGGRGGTVLEFPTKCQIMMMHDLIRHWEARRRAAARHSPALSPHPSALTVTLTREAGTEGPTVGQEVGTRLGWPVYDHALLERIAQEMGLRTTLLESVDEKRHGTWLTEAFEALMAIPTVNESAYVQHLIKTILALGVHGECVIVGRGAGHILPPETTLRSASHCASTIPHRVGKPKNRRFHGGSNSVGENRGSGTNGFYP